MNTADMISWFPVDVVYTEPPEFLPKISLPYSTISAIK